MGKWGVFFSRDLWRNCIFPRLETVDEFIALRRVNSSFLAVIDTEIRPRLKRLVFFRYASDGNKVWQNEFPVRRIFWLEPHQVVRWSIPGHHSRGYWMETANISSVWLPFFGECQCVGVDFKLRVGARWDGEWFRPAWNDLDRLAGAKEFWRLILDKWLNEPL